MNLVLRSVFWVALLFSAPALATNQIIIQDSSHPHYVKFEFDKDHIRFFKCETGDKVPCFNLREKGQYETQAFVKKIKEDTENLPTLAIEAGVTAILTEFDQALDSADTTPEKALAFLQTVFSPTVWKSYMATILWIGLSLTYFPAIEPSDSEDLNAILPERTLQVDDIHRFIKELHTFLDQMES